MKNGFDLKVKISYVFFGILLVILGGFLIFYVWFYRNGIPFGIIDITAYATGLFAILTLAYHSLNLESSHHFHKENLKIRKNQYSFEVIAKFHDPLMGKLWKPSENSRMKNRRSSKKKTFGNS